VVCGISHKISGNDNAAMTRLGFEAFKNVSYYHFMSFSKINQEVAEKFNQQKYILFPIFPSGIWYSLKPKIVPNFLG
jgi:hypothetical protein